MQESSQKAIIETLIRQLEEEVRKLSYSHLSELTRAREANAIELRMLNEKCEKLVLAVNSQYQLRLSDLESEIDYLKELNQAQRLMMEDSLVYIKGLEEKLNATRSLD